MVCLTEEGFRRSLLEMADLWTDSIDRDEYLKFINVVASVVGHATGKGGRGGQAGPGEGGDGRDRNKHGAGEQGRV